MGDPDQGIGPQQPGSWIYTTGPFMDLPVRFDIGAGLPWEEKKIALAEQMATVVPEFHCPSRRAAKAYPAFSPSGQTCENGVRPKNAALPAAVAKSDYAINGGNGSGWNRGAGGTGGAPEEYCLHDSGLGGLIGSAGYPNCNWHIPSPSQDMYWQRFNGVSGWRTAARISQISDGVSKTILVGEKFMQPRYYENSCPNTGSQPSKGNAGDNGSMYMGWDIDIARTGLLERDYDSEPYNAAGDGQFGGPHPRAANFAFCDGSVRSIRYGVENFERFVTRNDSDLPAN
jgi:prepilin-type processing-associated H-X9-DG protein